LFSFYLYQYHLIYFQTLLTFRPDGAIRISLLRSYYCAQLIFGQWENLAFTEIILTLLYEKHKILKYWTNPL